MEMRERESWETIPVTVLTGFPGAGKTALLRHMLQSHVQHGMRFAVIENGNAVSELEDHILKVASCERIGRSGHCVTCTIRYDLVHTLRKLGQQISSFDGVIIETTGMADPVPIVQTFLVDESIRRRYHLDGLITVVDPKNVMTKLEDANHEGVKNTFEAQLALADRIVLNKCDLVDEGQLGAVENALKCVNVYAAIFRSQMGCLEPSNLLNIRAADISLFPEMNPEYLYRDNEYLLETTVNSVHIHFVGELNLHKLQFWIRGLMRQARDLLRFRGVLALKGTELKCILQGVHEYFSCKVEQDYRWHENEFAECRECHLVLIGRSLDKAELEKGMMECKVGPLRFKLGDRVRVNVDGERWMDGIVVKLWDEGFPYVIEVELPPDSCGCPLKCWAPIDDDQHVKERESSCEKPCNAPSESAAYGTNASY